MFNWFWVSENSVVFFAHFLYIIYSLFEILVEIQLLQLIGLTYVYNAFIKLRSR